jgi:hypothetical protein
MTTDGLLAMMADGHLHFFGRKTNPAVFWGAVTPNKGEALSFD